MAESYGHKLFQDTSRAFTPTAYNGLIFVTICFIDRGCQHDVSLKNEMVRAGVAFEDAFVERELTEEAFIATTRKHLIYILYKSFTYVIMAKRVVIQDWYCFGIYKLRIFFPVFWTDLDAIHFSRPEDLTPLVMSNLACNNHEFFFPVIKTPISSFLHISAFGFQDEEALFQVHLSLPKL